MGVLQRFERRIEDMVNGPFARAFKAEVQPVEIAARSSASRRHRDDPVAGGRSCPTSSRSSSRRTTTSG